MWRGGRGVEGTWRSGGEMEWRGGGGVEGSCGSQLEDVHEVPSYHSMLFVHAQTDGAFL